MKIVIRDPAPGEEDSVTISVKFLTDSMTRAIHMLKSPDSVAVYIDGQALMLRLDDVYYAESVDLKTFVYAEKAVYRSRQKLYEIEETLNKSDFLRASKQVIVNVKKIKGVSPAGDGRLLAALDNGERVIISRQYVPSLKERFGL